MFSSILLFFERIKQTGYGSEFSPNEKKTEQVLHKSYWLMNLTWAHRVTLIGIVHDFLLKKTDNLA